MTKFDAYAADVALLGPDAPPIDRVEDLIRYLLTVQERFGNTAVTCNLAFGSCALNAKDDQARQIESLRRIVGAVVRNLSNCEFPTRGDDCGPLVGVTWGKVAWMCGLGSTSATALCREFGVDPDGKAVC